MRDISAARESSISAAGAAEARAGLLEDTGTAAGVTINGVKAGPATGAVAIALGALVEGGASMLPSTEQELARRVAG